MFEIFCPSPSHGCRVLLSSGRIRAVSNTGDGVVVEWECWCGHHGRSLGGETLSRRPAPVARAS